MRAKRHVNYIEKHSDSPGLNDRQKLIGFYFTKTTKTEYDNVVKTDFMESFGRFM